VAARFQELTGRTDLLALVPEGGVPQGTTSVDDAMLRVIYDEIALQRALDQGDG
jgi:hypothetical protein